MLRRRYIVFFAVVLGALLGTGIALAGDIQWQMESGYQAYGPSRMSCSACGTPWAFHSDIFDLTIPKIDLVYIDTPYISAGGIGVNYFDFYHFLEGIVFYDEWPKMIDKSSKHKKIKNGKNEWCNKGEIHNAFKKLFDKFKNSILVVSYRDDGTPTVSELINMLKRHKKIVEVKKMDYKYVLSNGNSKEVLIVAK